MLDVAVLLVSELVANSVLHAHTAISVVIRRNGDLLRIEVHDREERTPARKRYSVTATTGRGLMLVEQLARDWGVDAARTGKSVWFELDSSAAPAPGAAALAFALDLDDELDLFASSDATGPSPSRPPGDARRPREPRLRAGARS